MEGRRGRKSITTLAALHWQYGTGRVGREGREEKGGQYNFGYFALTVLAHDQGSLIRNRLQIRGGIDHANVRIACQGHQLLLEAVQSGSTSMHPWHVQP